MDYIPVDREDIRQQLEDANYQIEKFLNYVEKLKKSLSSISSCEGLLSLITYKEEYNKPSKSKLQKRTKEENLQFRNQVEKLSKLLLPNLSAVEQQRLMSDVGIYNACETYAKLLRMGYTDALIEQAVHNAVRDAFWAKQFRTLVKLLRKNRDDVFYIDVFLAMNMKSTKVSIPKIVR